MNATRQHLIDQAVEALRLVACYKATNGEWREAEVRRILDWLIDAHGVHGWQSDTP